MLKRGMCLMLTLALLVSLLACGKLDAGENLSEESKTVQSDPEIAKAETLGLVDLKEVEALEKNITYLQFTDLLDRLVALALPEKLEPWKTRSDSFRNLGAPMTRIEGATVLLYAAETIGADTLGFDESANLPGMIPEEYDFWEGITFDYPNLEGWQEIYKAEELENSNWSWRCEQDYLQNGLWFAQHRSYTSGKTYLDYDENFMMHFDAPFTWEAAVKAVLRLYETSQYIHYISIEEAECSLPVQTLTLGEVFPEASERKLPDWYGHTIGMRSWYAAHYVGQNYQEEEVKVLADQGFNFARIPLDARLFFAGEDFSRVNIQRMKDLDQLITWCAQYGIHVCLDLHDMPGFTTGGDVSATDLFDNPDRQRFFVEFWRFMARYYKEVPKNLLSFNLLNEPHSAGELTDEAYTAVMLPAIEAIREENPERIIFADMIGWLEGTPSWGLVETGVAQAWHPYLFTGDTAAEWPAYYINGFVHVDNGQLMMTGSFPAGTVLTLPISMFHSQGELVLKADDTEISALKLGTEPIGVNGCTEIGEEGTGGEYRSYENLVWEVTLPQDASSLAVQRRGDTCWYMIGASVTIQTPEHTYTVLTGRQLVPSEKVPQLTLLDDGSIFAQPVEALTSAGAEYLTEKFAQLAKFREETGIQIMAQEFGCSYKIPQQVAVPAMEDTLAAFAQLDIPWCVWCTDFGPLIDQRLVTKGLINREKTDYRREGSLHVPVSENWLANEELMKVFKKYMQ